MITLWTIFACTGTKSTSMDFAPVYGVANMDDDNENGTVDWEEGLFDTENDTSTLVIPVEYFAQLGKKESLVIRQESDGFKVYVDGTLKMNSAEDFFTLGTKNTEEDVVLEIEMQQMNTSGTLTIEKQHNGSVVDTVEVELISVPMLVNHHLQPAEHVYAMSGSGFVNNQDFIHGFQDALGNRFSSFNVSGYEWDVWIQDELEFSSLYSPESRLNIVIDSIRNRGLDTLPENEFTIPDYAVHTWGRGMATSQDSFGNLEASPPIAGHPYGRIYYGEWSYASGVDTITPDLTSALTAQHIQSPFTLDVSFLCVGHVDEYQSFIPDPSSPKGFKYVLADVTAGYEFLESLPSSMSLPKYTNDHHYASVGAILADNALRRLNEDIQIDYLDVTWEKMQQELGLTEEDVIRIPMLFEEAYQCGGYTATLFPSTLNMVVVTHDDGASADIIFPDPYLRSNVQDQSSDVFINHVNSLLPTANTAHWVDDWSEYHMMLGEVHCGSNTLRTPMYEPWNE